VYDYISGDVAAYIGSVIVDVCVAQFESRDSYVFVVQEIRNSPPPRT
jgi:hypothetical protein